MARYALVQNNKAVYIVEWDGNISTWSPPSGQIAVAIGSSEVGIGMTYVSGTNFIIEDNAEQRWKGDGPSDDSEDAKWGLMRSERDRKLTECDWTQVGDVPNAIKTKWQTYRQSLRDLPANTSDPLNPTWPSEPS